MVSDISWPGVSWEETAWRPSLPPGTISRTALRRHSGPYRAAVTAPIASRTPRLSSEVQAVVDQATAEISRFDAEIGTAAAPFTSILLRTESASSSQIEQITSSAKAIALAELGETSKSNAKLNVANVVAMQAATRLARAMTPRSILEMHRALLGESAPSIAGEWRSSQVWIGGSSHGPHGADFVPPRHERVADAISDLITFMDRDDLPVLTQAAIAHAQFETIHPFLDGNGRTGRALVHSLLLAKGLIRNVTLPISAGLLTDTERYFVALNTYRTGDPGAIVERFADAAFSAVANGRVLVSDLESMRKRWNSRIKARSDAVVWRLADFLLRQPVIRADLARSELNATSANIHRAIRQLTEAGILTEISGRKRNRLWQSREVLGALDDFAERSRRG